MEVAMDEVLNQGKICQATICYTGDILDPKRDKYTLDYYVKMAKEGASWRSVCWPSRICPVF